METKETTPDYFVRSGTVEALINTPPAWIVRWGISIMLSTVSLVVLISAFISYPDEYASEAIIYNLNPAVMVQAKASGRIEKSYINQGDHVSKGDPLFTIRPIQGDPASVLITSPINGTIDLAVRLNEGRLTAINQPLLTVKPDQLNWVIAASANPADIQAFEIGQEVIIVPLCQGQRLPSISGRIINHGSARIEGMIPLDIELDQVGLSEDLSLRSIMKNEMVAEIRTSSERLSLLSRIVSTMNR